MRREVLAAVGIGLALHGVITIGLPLLVLEATSHVRGTTVPLGSLRWLGVALVAAGLSLHVWALVRLLRIGTSALPLGTPVALEAGGCYARSRNPLLLGVVLILLGEAIATASVALLGYGLAYWLCVHLFVVRREEPRLRAAFGDEYVEYARRVPRWLPAKAARR